MVPGWPQSILHSTQEQLPRCEQQEAAAAKENQKEKKWHTLYFCFVLIVWPFFYALILILPRLSNGCLLEAKQIQCFYCGPNEDRVLVLTSTRSCLLCTANLRYQIEGARTLGTAGVQVCFIGNALKCSAIAPFCLNGVPKYIFICSTGHCSVNLNF